VQYLNDIPVKKIRYANMMKKFLPTLWTRNNKSPNQNKSVLSLIRAFWGSTDNSVGQQRTLIW